MAVSSMCRACAQRASPISSTRILIPLSANIQPRPSQPTRRHLSTTATEASPTKSMPPPSSSSPTTTKTSTNTTAPYNPTNPQTKHSLPKSLTPAQLLSLPTLLPTYPTPSYTATITHIHASTAHAARNLPTYNTHLRKHFRSQTSDLVHDPYSLLRVGDVIRYTAFLPSERAAREQVHAELDQKRMERLKAKRRLVGRPRASDGKRSKRTGVKFVVRQVVSAFGEGLEERMAKRVGDPEGSLGKGVRGRGKGVVVGVQEKERLVKRTKLPEEVEKGEKSKKVVA